MIDPFDDAGPLFQAGRCPGRESDETVRGDVLANTRLTCRISVRSLPVNGGAVSTGSGPDTSELLYATDPVSARLDDLEFVTGEGPCLQAYWNRSPVLEPDMTSPGAAARWPWFAPEAAVLGAGAVFAFPLQVDRMVFGVLSFYCRARGVLGGRNLSTALAMAQAAAAAVLNDVAEHSREQLDTHFRDSDFDRVSVHQALGMIAVQRNTDIGQARVLLRSTAYAQNRTSRAVAEDVLAQRLTYQ